MYKDFLVFDQSGWWILLFLAVAAGIAYFLYSKPKQPWNRWQNILLGTLRLVSVFLGLVLLLEPLVRQVVNHTEAPVIAIGIDNSQSVTARKTDSLMISGFVNELQNNLDDEYDIRTFTLNDSSSFSHPFTDISALFRKIDNYMEGRNLAAIVLLSDGIFNKGSSPVHRPYLAPVFTVGLGDTIPPKDINISRVQYNRVTFKGNQTPVRLEIRQKGYTNQTVTVSLREKGKVLEKKDIRLTQSIQEVEFLVTSDEDGLRRLVASIPIATDESIAVNNQSDIFIEVIDGQQKVLITAPRPHPDIKAIRSALSSSDNYKTEVYIRGIHKKAPTEIFDVVIYHGAFAGRNNFKPKENPGTWYILNNESNINSINNGIPYLSIVKRGSWPDRVTGTFNRSFSKFKIPEGVDVFEEFPPLEVPFGDYRLSGGTETLIYQQLGNIKTGKPLLVFADDGTQKSATLMGQNIWKWKLQESAINENAQPFNDLVIKTVQFLSVKNDKKQFRFTSRGNTFTDGEGIVFDAEIYNEIYERIYGNKINLGIGSSSTDEQRFEFIDSELNSTFKVPDMEPGIYRYTATTRIGSRTFTEKGEFLVRKIHQEYLNVTADHHLLQLISARSGGGFVPIETGSKLIEQLNAKDFRNIIRSAESSFPLRNNQWVLVLLLVIFSAEWFLRKYWGGY